MRLVCLAGYFSFNGLRGNSEVSAKRAKYAVCFVGYIINMLIPL